MKQKTANEQEPKRVPMMMTPQPSWWSRLRLPGNSPRRRAPPSPPPIPKTEPILPKKRKPLPLEDEISIFTQLRRTFPFPCYYTGCMWAFHTEPRLITHIQEFHLSERQENISVQEGLQIPTKTLNPAVDPGLADEYELIEEVLLENGFNLPHPRVKDRVNKEREGAGAVVEPHWDQVTSTTMSPPPPAVPMKAKVNNKKLPELVDLVDLVGEYEDVDNIHSHNQLNKIYIYNYRNI